LWGGRHGVTLHISARNRGGYFAFCVAPLTVVAVRKRVYEQHEIFPELRLSDDSGRGPRRVILFRVRVNHEFDPQAFEQELEKVKRDSRERVPTRHDDAPDVSRDAPLDKFLESRSLKVKPTTDVRDDVEAMELGTECLYLPL
jgi:hypothetical protein